MAYTTIDDPSAHFQTKIWTGNDTSQSITNDGNSNLKPDWIWAKKRSASDAHNLVDTSRGLTNYIFSNVSNGDTTDSSKVQSMDLNGFSVGASNSWNDNNVTYVAWQWKCNGGTTSSNSDGSITTTVQANTTAGFSIVTWTGTGSNATIGHGLGVVPQLIISKSRGHGENWAVYHQNSNSTPEDYYLALDDERANTDSAVVWNDTAPTSSVISIGTQDKINKSGSTHIAYCFNEIKGYSKFGSYTGNGAQDGTFVYTGFKPAFILAKRTDTSGKNWYIADSTRSPSNITKAFLSPNLSNAEDTSGDTTDAYFDILSNGFKMRQDFSHLNASGSTQIYMAFAENPFVSSKGVPTTAR